MVFNFMQPPVDSQPSSPPTGGGSAAPPPSGGGGVGGPVAAPAVPLIPGPGQGGARFLGSDMFQVLRLTPDRTEYGPTLFVGANDVVTVQPRRQNTVPCFVATSGNSDAKFDPRLQLAATDNPVTISVATLKQIGVYSTVVGEGVLITLMRHA